MAEPSTHLWKDDRLSHWLVQNWAKSFQEAFAALQLSGSAPQVKLEPQPPNPDVWAQWREPQWFELAGNMAPRAVLSIGCAADTARSLASLITGEQETASETVRETYLELLSQAGSSLATVASGRLGKTIQFSPPVESSPPTQEDLGVEFRFTVSGVTHLLAVVPNEALVEALVSKPAAPQATQPSRSVSRIGSSLARASAVRPSREGPVPLSTTAQQNLGMLLEVELELSVSFGRTQLPLRNVLKLCSGSIVELNRSVADPVDVVVNNRVIARGQVVVVEGNYGIRITEIVSRQERIRSIF